jgi:type I restriction enzyme R subunit
VYLRVREILALAADYSPSEPETQAFFQVVQNKLHFAATGMTAPELIAERVDAALPNMGLTTWKGGVVRKGDVTVAKNYLRENEISELNRIVVMFLDFAEDQAFDRPLTEGVAQAKDYAGKMALRFAYATNGQGIYGVDMETGKEGEVARYPSPDEIWSTTFAKANAWRDLFAAVPFEDKGGSHPSRYYQDIAVERVMEAIAEDRQRILLTLATGTGKTFIAFQIAWKLFHSRWNLSREPTRRPRILFLADRNILADQAYNAFSAFAEDAMARIDPADIQKKGKVPTNASLFFTIFQTFMSGPPKDGKPAPYFGDTRPTSSISS